MKTKIGGCFAPPLTDELLNKYRQQIDAVEPQSRLRDALEVLWRCTTAWWGLPQSSTKRKRHPSGRGYMQPLDDATAQAIFETTPWPDDLAVVHPILDEIQREECRRNEAKLVVWRRAVAAALWPKHFSVSQESVAAFYRLHATAARVSASLAEGTRLLFPDMPADVDSRWTAWQAGVRDALAVNGNPPVRRPDLESTALRDMAFHLLFHADELANDREPAWNDVL